MDDLLRQIDDASNAGLYFAALYSALTIPDNCAALCSENGETTGPKYKAWFDQWVAPKYTGRRGTTVTGDVCYYYRCAMLHQGRSHHPRMPYERIIFLEPNSQFGGHNNTINNALHIDVQRFVSDITSSAREWWAAHAADEIVARNWEQSTRRHPEGIFPYIVGIPVIG